MSIRKLVRPEKSTSLPVDASISIKNVSFGYGNQEVLHNINLEIKSGSQIALVGPSGAGKSTIAKLIASLWEITIKRSIGKLNIQYSASDIAKACNEKAIAILGIKPIHLDEIPGLPSIHNDPFDRLIISQAKAEGMTLVSKDGKFAGYNISLYWG